MPGNCFHEGCSNAAWGDTCGDNGLAADDVAAVSGDLLCCSLESIGSHFVSLFCTVRIGREMTMGFEFALWEFDEWK